LRGNNWGGVVEKSKISKTGGKGVCGALGVIYAAGKGQVLSKQSQSEKKWTDRNRQGVEGGKEGGQWLFRALQYLDMKGRVDTLKIVYIEEFSDSRKKGY